MSERFPLIFLPLNPATAAPRREPAEDRRAAYRGDRTTVAGMFDAAITGVRTRFPHLAADDIAFPPHQWFDAALARQIALHLLVTRFDVPKRAVAEELERSREAVNRALRTIDDRLQYPDFQDAYSAMAEGADAALSQGGDDG